MKRLREIPWQRWALAALVLFAFALRSEGMRPAAVMHPDERVIIDWMGITRDEGWLKGTTYPGGFFVLAETARRVSERVLFRPWQGWLYHSGQISRPETSLRPADFGRHFNVWLGALTVVLIYLLCLRVCASRAAALVGAALFAFAAYHVEHSHYLETDVAMVATLTLALWLWVRQAQEPRWDRLAAAAIATGYAAGTKYTLVLLIPLALLFALGRTAGERGNRSWVRAGRAARRLAAVAVAAAVGFVAATRQAWNLSWFLEHLRRHGMSVYNETEGIIGPASTEPWVRQLHHLGELRHYLGSLGAGWLLLAVAGLPLLFTRERRRFWPVTLLFPGVYLLYFVFKAPFVRTQEFMNLLPSFAIAAAVAAAWAIERVGRARAGAAGRAAVGILLFALVLPTARLGIAAASRCGWVDTRIMARNWLRQHLPHETNIAAEQYSPPATQAVARADTDVDKIEINGLSIALKAGSAFLVRNPSATGRGLFDPRTGELYPEAQAKLDAFRSRAERLRVWSVIGPGQPRVTFRSPTLELWALQRPGAGPVLDIALAQPMVVSETGRETFFPIGSDLGTADGALVDRYGREVAVGGPGAPTQPVFIVLNTQERPAQVNLEGFGRSREVDLQPFDAVAVPLQRPWWLPRFGSFERIRAATRPQKLVDSVPCWMRVAFDATGAARLLEELGRPERAWALLEQYAGGTDPGLAFRVAVATGRTAEAAALAPASAAQLRQMEGVLSGEIAAWRLNGLAAARYDELARLRDGARGVVTAIELRRGGDPGDGETSSIEALQAIPLRLAVPSLVRMEVLARGGATRGGGEDRLEIRDAAGGLLYGAAWSDLAGPVFHPLRLALAGTARERPVDLRWKSTRRGLVEVRNIEVTWSLADVLRARVRAQRIAEVRWHLGRGALSEARAARAALPELGPADFDVDQRRLDFELALVEGRADGIEKAARSLLERAPEHYAALRALAGVDPRSAQAADRLAGNEGEAVVFEPLATIRGAAVASGRLRLVVEALRDDTPPLVVELRERKIARWADRERAALSPLRALFAGERVVLDLPLGQVEPARLGVSIVADVPLAPGALPARGETTVPAGELPHGPGHGR